MRTATHRRHPQCMCTCTAAPSPHVRKHAPRRAQACAERCTRAPGCSAGPTARKPPGGSANMAAHPSEPSRCALMRSIALQRAGGSGRAVPAPLRPVPPAQSPHTHLEVGLRAALIPRGDGVEHLSHTQESGRRLYSRPHPPLSARRAPKRASSPYLVDINRRS